METVSREYASAYAQAMAALLEGERQRLGLTYAAMGNRAGMTSTQVHRYLVQGRDIPMSKMPALTNSVGLDPIAAMQRVEAILREH